MDWVVVKFTETNEVDAVPSCWYSEETSICLYPSYTKQKLEKAMKLWKEPEKDWKPYKAILVTKKKFDNLASATIRMNKAILESDTSDKEEFNLPLKRKSKRVVDEAYTSASPYDSEESLPEVPNTNKNDDNILRKLMPIQDNQGRAMMPHKSVNYYIHLHIFIVYFNYSSGHQENSDIDVGSCNDSSVSQTSATKQMLTYLVKIKHILRDQEKKIESVQAGVDENKITLEKNLERMHIGHENTLDTSSAVNVFHLLPIKTLEEFEEVNKVLSNEKNYNTFVSNLRRLGGKTYRECVRRFLLKTIVDEVARLYSLHGHKGKLVFSGTQLFQAVSDAVLQCDKNVTQKDVEISAGIWLAKASERLKKEATKNDNIK